MVSATLANRMWQNNNSQSLKFCETCENLSRQQVYPMICSRNALYSSNAADWTFNYQSWIL